MKKTTVADAKSASPWDDEPTKQEIMQVAESISAPDPQTPTEPVVPEPLTTPPPEYDLEGLMTDFPTAKDLERFVFDETGRVLNLKGRANKLKYQIAMDVLNGQEVDAKFIGNENPYVDKNDMVPIEELKEPPKRDVNLPNIIDLQNSFYSPLVTHTDPDFRARGKKVHCVFRKYKTGEISYEILGPLDQVAHGTKIDKYGRERPEIIKWVDPRTGEQLVQRSDGTLTPVGRRLRSMMQGLKVNKTNQWEVWVDREFAELNTDAAANPWDLS
jgi:hypothetical protein